jgi:formylglycine-generating enzyme required for sulfatase activity
MGNNWAIVVGINHYRFLPDATLRFAGNDALAMKSFLCDKAGFRPEKVLLCRDSGEESDRDATRTTLRDILLHDIQHAANADNLWFVFSGHGVDDYLMPFDGNPRDLRETAIPISFVTECLRMCKAKNIVIVLDMCRNENFDTGQRSMESIEDSLRNLVKDREGQQGIITLFSCSRGERSYEVEELEQGAFTYALLEGLKKERTLKELERYLEERVPEIHNLYASEKRRKQVPLVIPEPGWKYEKPILDVDSTEVDVSGLKDKAIDAENAGDVELAQLLWKQVNLFAITLEDRSRALSRITALQQSGMAKSSLNEDLGSSENKERNNPIVLPTFKFQYATISEDLTIVRNDGIASFYCETINDSSLDMVKIPAGTFYMGSNDFDRERPIHQVTVRDFMMGKYPVTQAQWKAVAKLKRQNRSLHTEPSHFQGDDRPIERVSWDDAVEFCDRLSIHSGKTYRLPSEAEWEYACRAGTTTAFHFGDTIDASLANYNSNDVYGKGKQGDYRKQTTVVGSFPGNAWGLFDCHGNVWEWCSDNWHDTYIGAPTDGSSRVTIENIDYQMQRGGTWLTSPIYCRSAYRSHSTRGHYHDNVGFRVARSV